MKKVLSLLLTLLVTSSMLCTVVLGKEIAYAAPTLDALTQNASVLISESDFSSVSKIGMIREISPFTDYMSASRYTVPESDNMTFKYAMEIKCFNKPSSWIFSAVKINFDKSSNEYKSIKSGDTLLLKYTAKATDGDGLFSVRLWNSADQQYNLIYQSATIAVSSDWETYYYPLTVSDPTLIPDQLIFKTSADLQTIVVGDFELLNLGTSVTKAQLCEALVKDGAKIREDSSKLCDFYISSPDKIKQDASDTPDTPEGTDVMIISPEHFVNKAATSGNGSIAKTSITEDVAEKFGLGFTDTVTATSTKEGGIASFTVSCGISDDAVTTKNGDIVLLTFYARSKTKVTRVKAAIVSESGTTLTNTAGADSDKAEYTYFIPTQWTKICLPATVSGKVGGVKLQMGTSKESIEFGGVSISVAEEGTAQFDLPAGYFLCEPYERLIIDYNTDYYLEKSIVKNANDLEIHGDYIYAIGGGNLFVISTRDERVVGTVSGMGETRQLAINEDATTAVVTSRVDGAFVIALDDKTNPQIVGRCDTVEYATGVAMADNFCYITNRMHGTEIIDLSDRTLPVNVANMKTGEAQSCEIVGTTLFAGCWGERRVEAWDVSQPSKPVLLNKNIPTNGKGDGLCVLGNLLFVASGHSENYKAGKYPLNSGYGLGNALDIYDITDITSPVHLSCVKIDDHFYVNGQDFWTVKVAKSGDKIFAYLTNTFNGVYIFDVTNPEAPIRRAVIELTLTKEKNAAKYNSIVNSYGHSSLETDRYFPFDTYVRHNSPVGGIAVSDGKIYVGGVSTGIAVVDTGDVGDILYLENREEGLADPEKPDGTFYDIDYLSLYDAGFTEIDYALPGGQIYGVCEKDGLIYAACGNQGIKILDSSLKVIKQFPVEGLGIVSEVVIRGNRLYSAEGLSGIAIYEMSEDGMEIREISRYISAYSPGSSSIYSVKFIRLSPDGNYVLCDSGSSHSELVDFTDLENPVRWNGEGAYNKGWNPHTGLMYFRQISTELIGGRYLCSYGYAGKTYWYDFGTNPEKSSPVLMFMNPKCGLDMEGGFGALQGKNSKYAIGVANNQFFIFNPGETTADTLYASFPHYSFLGENSSGRKVTGKPTIFGDIMLIADKIGGYCWAVDISGIDVEAGKFDAKLLAYFKVTGSPDVAKVIGNKLVYPLGNQGILSLTLPEYSDNKTVKLSFEDSTVENAPDGSAENLAKITLSDSLGKVHAVLFEGDKNGSSQREFTATVPKGTYTVKIQKDGYLTYSTSLNVTDSGAEHDTVKLIPGDTRPSKSLPADGKINMGDILRILKSFGKSNAMYDINKDGKVGIHDIILALLNYGKAYA